MPNSESSTDSETTASVGSTDPQVIHSIAVTVDDLITALEANCSANRGAVLRITPPFVGRMRARIHVAGGEGVYDGDTEPIHLDPEWLVDEVPEYPTADDTAEPDDDPEIHRRRHTDNVAEWRETVRERLREEITVSHANEAIAMCVLYLG